jgi:hypothetical protein
MEEDILLLLYTSISAKKNNIDNKKLKKQDEIDNELGIW